MLGLPSRVVPEHPQHPGSGRAARRWVHRVDPWAAWSPGCCWLSEDRVGVGTERSGRSRRSAAGTGLWVWER